MTAIVISKIIDYVLRQQKISPQIIAKIVKVSFCYLIFNVTARRTSSQGRLEMPTASKPKGKTRIDKTEHSREKVDFAK